MIGGITISLELAIKTELIRFQEEMECIQKELRDIISTSLLVDRKLEREMLLRVFQEKQTIVGSLHLIRVWCASSRILAILLVPILISQNLFFQRSIFEKGWFHSLSGLLPLPRIIEPIQRFSPQVLQLTSIAFSIILPGFFVMRFCITLAKSACFAYGEKQGQLFLVSEPRMLFIYSFSVLSAQFLFNRWIGTKPREGTKKKEEFQILLLGAGQDFVQFVISSVQYTFHWMIRLLKKGEK